MTTTVLEREDEFRDENSVEKRTRLENGRLIRRIFRIHFYAGMIAGPILLMLALTGLVILYTQPLQDLIYGGKLTVPAAEGNLPLQNQVNLALNEFPGYEVASVIPSPDPEHATVVGLKEGHAAGHDGHASSDITNVFVNPHTGEVTGHAIAGNDIIGLANRLHGHLNNESITIPLPSISHFINAEENPDLWVDIPVGRMIVEIMTVWALVLAITGIYLWWPRKSQKSKRLLSVRWSKGGRLRWQDLHSSTGIVLSGFLAIFIITGMPWSAYWGTDWGTITSKLTPNQTPVTESTPIQNNDLNGPGNSMEWAGRNDHVPGSMDHAPARLDFTAIEHIAHQLGMLPGYSIDAPVDTTEDGKTTYGSYSLANYWPQKLEERRTVYVDQFSGKTLFDATAGTMGGLKAATSWGVNLHMGTEFGIITRILSTLGCLLVIVSIASSYVMWWKRRPSGSAGLPNRPKRDPQLRNKGTKAMAIIGATLAIVYPSFGVTLLAVVGIDALYRYVRDRRTPAAAAAAA